MSNCILSSDGSGRGGGVKLRQARITFRVTNPVETFTKTVHCMDWAEAVALESAFLFESMNQPQYGVQPPRRECTVIGIEDAE